MKADDDYCAYCGRNQVGCLSRCTSEYGAKCCTPACASQYDWRLVHGEMNKELSERMRIESPAHKMDAPDMSPNEPNENESNVVVERPEWGEKVSFGAVLGTDENFLHRPLNQAALNMMMPWFVMGLLLHDRIKTLEERIEALETKVR